MAPLPAGMAAMRLIHLPDMNGIEVSRRLMDLLPNLKVIILTGDDEELFLGEALNVGITGYLLKACSGSDLEKAIQTVMKGKVYVSSINCDKSPKEPLQIPSNKSPDPVHPLLSVQECTVLRLMVGGERSKAIARRLNVSTGTVYNYRQRLKQKLGLAQDAELIRFALREKLVIA